MSFRVRQNAAAGVSCSILGTSRGIPVPEINRSFLNKIPSNNAAWQLGVCSAQRLVPCFSGAFNALV